MNNLLSCGLAAALCACTLAPTACVATPEPEPRVSAPAQESGSAFAFDVFRALAAEKKGNITFSPDSLEAVLALLGELSVGASHEELTALRMGERRVASSLAPERANALFVADHLKLKPSVKGPLHLAPFATHPAQAAEAINDWCEEKTRGLIPELISESDINPNTRLVALNALYLKGKWLHPFDPRDSYKADFHSAKGPQTATFMTTKGSFRLAAGKGWRAVALFYATEGRKGEPACFIGILPTGNARDFAAQMTLEQYNAIRRALAEAPAKRGIRVTLPKMTIDSGSFSLKQALQASGVQQCFRDIDLSRLLEEDDLYLADAVQRCRVEINEEGTTAAAATAAIVKERSLSPEITFDRPFIWVIGDVSSAAPPFFIGLCETP